MSRGAAGRRDRAMYASPAESTTTQREIEVRATACRRAVLLSRVTFQRPPRGIGEDATMPIGHDAEAQRWASDAVEAGVVDRRDARMHGQRVERHLVSVAVDCRALIPARAGDAVEVAVRIDLNRLRPHWV